MVKRLFLHVGAMKSGTTYLQGLFSSNQERLEVLGVRWVRASRAEIVQILEAGEHVTSAKSMARRLRHAAKGWDGDLLSSMELMGIRESRFQRRLVAASGADEVHIIVTGRDLSRVIPSRWQTTTHNRHSWTWAEYVQAVCSDDPDATAPGRTFWKHQDLAQMFRSWSAVAEPHRMHLVTVPAASTDRQLLWHRFAEVLGIDPAGYRDPNPRRANPSLSMTAAEVLRRVNPLVNDLSYPLYRRGVTDLTYQIFGDRPADEPPLQVPETHRDWVDKRAQRMNDEITKLGVNVVGDLNDLLPGPPDPHGVQVVEVGDAELVDTAVTGFAGTIRILARTRLDHDALQHQYAMVKEQDRLKEQPKEPRLRERLRRLVLHSRIARRPGRRRRAWAAAFVATAAAATLLAVTFALGLDDQGTAEQAQTPTPAEQIAYGFLDAYAASDSQGMAAYLPEGADHGGLWDDTDRRWREAAGYQMLNESCQQQATETALTLVMCTFDYHMLGSDQIGRGPFAGDKLIAIVKDDQILATNEVNTFPANGFSNQMWLPFSDFVAGTYPEDAAIMYSDWPSHDSAAKTDRSYALWAEHTQDFVDWMNENR